MKKSHISSALEKFYIIRHHTEQGVATSQIMNFHSIYLTLNSARIVTLS